MTVLDVVLQSLMSSYRKLAMILCRLREMIMVTRFHNVYRCVRVLSNRVLTKSSRLCSVTAGQCGVCRVWHVGLLYANRRTHRRGGLAARHRVRRVELHSAS